MSAKRKKPQFIRQESWRYKRVGGGWRKPRGKSSRMRRRIRGWPPMVRVGYKGPKLYRGLHPSGFREVLVSHLRDLEACDPKLHAVRIAHTVGKRRRAAILERAGALGLHVLNPGIKETEEALREELIVEEPRAEGREAAEESLEPLKERSRRVEPQSSEAPSS